MDMHPDAIVSMIRGTFHEDIRRPGVLYDWMGHDVRNHKNGTIGVCVLAIVDEQGRHPVIRDAGNFWRTTKEYAEGNSIRQKDINNAIDEFRP